MSDNLKNQLEEIVEYIQASKGTDKQYIREDILATIPQLNGLPSDEVTLQWDDTELMLLQDFAENFYSALADRICNVIKSAQSELKEEDLFTRLERKAKEE